MLVKVLAPESSSQEARTVLRLSVPGNVSYPHNEGHLERNMSHL